MTFQKHLGAGQKLFSMFSWNSSHTCYVSSDRAKAAVLQDCGAYDSVWGSPLLEAPRTFRPKLSATVWRLKFWMLTTLICCPQPLRGCHQGSGRGESYSSRVWQGTPPDIPSSPTLYIGAGQVFSSDPTHHRIVICSQLSPSLQFR